MARLLWSAAVDLNGSGLFRDEFLQCLRDHATGRAQSILARPQPQLAEYRAIRHEVYTSLDVIDELSAPTYPNRVAALAHAAGIPLLPISSEAFQLAHLLVDQMVMPGPIKGDAMHVAIAAFNHIEYLLSWNVKHLANPNKRIHLARVLGQVNLAAPAIVTPDILWEDDDA